MSETDSKPTAQDPSVPPADRPSLLPSGFFEGTPKVLAVLATTSYAIGLITLNTYLLNIGVSDFDLFKPRYILTGALALSVLTVSVLAPLGAWHLVAKWTLGRGTPLGYRLLGALNGLFLAVLPFFLAWWPLRQSHVGAILLYGVSGIFGFLLLLTIAFLRGMDAHWRLRADARRKEKGLEPRWEAPHMPRAVAVVMMLIFLIPYAHLCMTQFAYNVLPAVPEQLGGTEPRYVRLLVGDPVKDNAAALELPMQGTSSPLSAQLVLLYEGSDFYVLTPIEGDRIIRLGKDSVLAMRVDVEAGI